MAELFDRLDEPPPPKLSRAEKHQAILQALAEDPRRSDREIARLVGVHHQLVAAVRKSSSLVTPGELKSSAPSKSSSKSPTIEPTAEIATEPADPLNVILDLLPKLDWGELAQVIEAACPDNRQRPRLREPVDWRELLESGDGYAWWLVTAPLDRMRDPDERALRKRAMHALGVSRRAQEHNNDRSAG